ncbi:MAG: 30S ribosome-binding factor RbfA [Myxococcota bacterium]
MARKSSRGDGGSSRPARVAERVRVELGELLMRGTLGDPGARDAVVSAVRMSGDLSIARVYVRTLGQASPGRQRALVEALERGAGRLRSQLAGRLQLRRAPELRFFWDDVVDSAGRIEGILDELRHEGEEGA